MNGAPLTYASVVLHQAELRSAAERNRRAPREAARERRAPALRLRRKPRFA